MGAVAAQGVTAQGRSRWVPWEAWDTGRCGLGISRHHPTCLGTVPKPHSHSTIQLPSIALGLPFSSEGQAGSQGWTLLGAKGILEGDLSMIEYLAVLASQLPSETVP